MQERVCAACTQQSYAVTAMTQTLSAFAARKRSRSAAARKESTTAVGHDGRVTGILPTPDGLHWLTAGTDNRLRLWDARHNYHLLVNYPQTFNSSMKVRALVTWLRCSACVADLSVQHYVPLLAIGSVDAVCGS